MPDKLSCMREWFGNFNLLCLPVLASCLLDATLSGQTTPDANWPYYGGDAGGMRYSPLTQIDRDNVSKLKIAWVFHTGDISDGKRGKERTGFETTPILVDGILFFTTGFNRVIAADPKTGKQKWSYDPKIDSSWDYGDALVNRGVATWLDPARTAEAGPCRRRIYEALLDARLIALDAATGLPCGSFGNEGEVSLRDVPRYRSGQYHMTSPPAVIDDLVIVGSAINDNDRADMPGGVVRAFDARTGVLRWSWDPIDRKDQTPSGGNNSTKMRQAGGFGGPITTASGLVFIAGTFDPFIRAFDVETGKELWKAQLPASGNATPMTYSVNGKQYLVIAAGGHPKIKEEALNDTLVAFTLP